MTDIVERLRRWWEDPHASSASDLMDEAADEIALLRLTDAEREAVQFFTGFHTLGYGMIEAHAATLRALLARLA
jgi:hypothetical protein